MKVCNLSATNGLCFPSETCVVEEIIMPLLGVQNSIKLPFLIVELGVYMFKCIKTP